MLRMLFYSSLLESFLYFENLFLISFIGVQNCWIHYLGKGNLMMVVIHLMMHWRYKYKSISN